jgi:hypothetical protein
MKEGFLSTAHEDTILEAGLWPQSRLLVTPDPVHTMSPFWTRNSQFSFSWTSDPWKQCVSIYICHFKLLSFGEFVRQWLQKHYYNYSLNDTYWLNEQLDVHRHQLEVTQVAGGQGFTLQRGQSPLDPTKATWSGYAFHILYTSKVTHTSSQEKLMSVKLIRKTRLICRDSDQVVR